MIRRLTSAVAVILALILASVAVFASDPASYPRDESHDAYMNGKEDGLFHPSDHLTRAEAAQIFYNLFGTGQKTRSFPDVRDGAWYSDAVRSLAGSGVIVGYNDDTFRPEKEVTRAEFVTLLSRLSGESGEEKKSFRDVDADHWASAFVALAKKRGWVSGYPGGVFKPDECVTRAEAAAIVNRYSNRRADRMTVEFSSDIRFFPDVKTDAWYYADVAEATVPHTARLLGEAVGEIWRDHESVRTVLGDGFHVINGGIFLVCDGYFVRSEESGVYEGVAYSCTGRDGVCTVDRSFLEADGKLYVIDGKSGAVVTEEGPREVDGMLYCVGPDFALVQNAYWRGLCFGPDGTYTSGNKTIDSFVEKIISENTTDSMTPTEKLRACYEYVFYHVDYRANNARVPFGADPSTWCEEYMLRLITEGKGNCYCYASEMWYIARRLGFWQAKAISGTATITRVGEHGWLEINVDGVDTVSDPELEQARFSSPGNLFLTPYDKTPWKYDKP